MSRDGYVPLSLIASFNRVQTLCDDIKFIAEVMVENSQCNISSFVLGSERQFNYRNK